MKESPRAAMYLRISQDALGDGLAIERQRAECERIAEARGWVIAAEFAETVSASRRDARRPLYAAMFAAFEAGEYDALLVWDLDRLTRKPAELEKWIELAEDQAVLIVTANGEADLTTDNGRMFARIKATVARAEVERKNTRQRARIEQNIERGLPAPGRRRFGYETDGATAREAEAAVVRRMFGHVAAGGSIRSLALALSAEGVDPAPGKAWSTRRVRDILLNETYGGFIRHRGAAMPSSLVAAVVDPEQAAEVRAILADPSRKTSPGHTPRHLLSGLAHCGVCGDPLVHMRGYRCRAGVGGHPFIRADWLEERVKDAVAFALFTSGPSLFPPSDGRSIVPLVAEHERNVAAVEALLSDRDEGLIPAATARARLVELRDARQGIERELERARTEKSAGAALHEIAQSMLAPGLDLDLSRRGEHRKEVIDRFDALPLEERRAVVRALVYVELAPGRGPDRIYIEHRVATHLNDDSADRRHADD